MAVVGWVGIVGFVFQFLWLFLKEYLAGSAEAKKREEAFQHNEELARAAAQRALDAMKVRAITAGREAQTVQDRLDQHMVGKTPIPPKDMK